MPLVSTVASAAVTSGPLYRYNEDKTLAWVKKKVIIVVCMNIASILFMQIDKLVMTLQEEQVDISSGSKSQLLKRNSQRNNTGKVK